MSMFVDTDSVIPEDSSRPLVKEELLNNGTGRALLISRKYLNGTQLQTSNVRRTRCVFTTGTLIKNVIENVLLHWNSSQRLLIGA